MSDEQAPPDGGQTGQEPTTAEALQQTQTSPDAAPAEAPKEPEKQPAAEISAQLRSIIEAEAQKRQAEAQAAERQRQESRAAELIALAKKDPEGFIASVGGDVSRLQQKQKKNDDVRAELEQLRTQLAQREQKEQAYLQQAQMEQVRRGVRSFVESREDFPLTKATGNADAVYDTLIAHHQAGNPISEEEAARQVESNLASYVEKAMSLEQYRSKYAGKQQPNGSDSDFPSLSQLDGATSRANTGRPATEAEIAAELMAALHGD